MIRRTGTLVALILTSIALTSSLKAANRVNNIVRVVRQTRDSIITIKVEKPTSTKDVVGTGVIIDESGYAVTNYHVVRGYSRVKVYLRDGTYLKSSVYKEIPSHDLAVLKVQSRQALKPLRLGPASDLMVGEDVIAIGHPYGYTNTVSKGIISAVGREITMPSGVALTNLIQTTADINPGNSGGALLNVNGELIGINVALRKGAQGIAFALNADSVQRVLSRYLSSRKISGVRHGLYCRERVVEGPARQKVIVDEVDRATPASYAGLREGDEIITVGTRSVWNRFDVERSFWRVQNDTVPVTINRRGFKLTLELKVRSGVAVSRR